MEENLSLYQLLEHLRRVIALNYPKAIWIEAELVQANYRRGHWYLELSQQDEQGTIIAQCSAAIWQTNAQSIQKEKGQQLKSLLEAGRTLKIQVQPQFHERYGFKLNVVDIDLKYHLGQLALKRQATINYLEQQGLLNKNKERPIPLVCQRIAVISAPQASGYQDFINQINKNSYQYSFHIQLFSAIMQGNKAPKQIILQLKKLERLREQYDVVIIIRGGGAKLDLVAFDNQELAEAIAQHSLPILAGIGHETDQSIVDIVAHQSLKTPTAVANYLLDHNLLFESEVVQTGELIFKAIHHNWQQASAFLAQQQLQLKQLSFFALERKKMTLTQLSQQINISAPAQRLKQGYAIVQQGGKRLSSTEMVNKGEPLIIQLTDGTITSNVIQIEPHE